MDPYSVLGVPQSASDEEIKKAYRELCKKYHPDHQMDDVAKEMAEEKMAGINAAYDQIMDMRRSGQQSGGYTGQASQSGGEYSYIRTMIQQGNYTQADQALEQNKNTMSAEWNFLKGTVSLSRGWLNDAYNYYQNAVQLDPQNNEYRMAFSQLQNKKGGFMNGASNMNTNYNQGQNNACGGCDLCDICSALMCLDCMCDCF